MVAVADSCSRTCVSKLPVDGAYLYHQSSQASPKSCHSDRFRSTFQRRSATHRSDLERGFEKRRQLARNVDEDQLYGPDKCCIREKRTTEEGERQSWRRKGEGFGIEGDADFVCRAWFRTKRIHTHIVR